MDDVFELGNDNSLAIDSQRGAKLVTRHAAADFQLGRFAPIIEPTRVSAKDKRRPKQTCSLWRADDDRLPISGNRSAEAIIQRAVTGGEFPDFAPVISAAFITGEDVGCAHVCLIAAENDCVSGKPDRSSERILGDGDAWSPLFNQAPIF